MADTVLARQFEDFEMANEIGMNVIARRLDAVADAGLGAEVDDGIGYVGADGSDKGSAIGEISRAEAEGWMLADEGGEAGVFECRRVIGIEIIDADDAVAPAEQRRCDMGADEAGGTGDENQHVKPFGMSCV